MDRHTKKGLKSLFVLCGHRCVKYRLWIRMWWYFPVSNPYFERERERESLTYKKRRDEKCLKINIILINKGGLHITYDDCVLSIET